MAHISGTFAIDAPASALNNAGAEPGATTDNTVAVKYIRTGAGERFPYVSAQAFRYWLRTTIERNGIAPGPTAPVFREQKVAYTDANPLLYWDDDLLGYMRAPSRKASAKEARKADASRERETVTEETLTRASPFRVSTLVSIAPVNIVDDFGVMSRHDGDPVPHEHQFYRTTLKGLFSLDLSSVGTFTYRNKTGYKNLDEVRMEQAVERGLEHLEEEKAYRLPASERASRVAALFAGFARIEGGAKQSIHYTDVAPSVTVTAVTRGGNNPFVHVIGADARGRPSIRPDALTQALSVAADDLLSPVYVGWATGYLDAQREEMAQGLREAGLQYTLDHPRRALERLADDVGGQSGRQWLE